MLGEDRSIAAFVAPVQLSCWIGQPNSSGNPPEGAVTRTEFGARNLEVLVRAQAAVAARHVRSASSRRTRSVRREVRWRWTLNVLWTAA